MSIENEIKKTASSLSKRIETEVDRKVKDYTKGSVAKSLAFGEMNVKQYFDLRKKLDEIGKYDLLVGIPDDTTGRNNNGKEKGITNAELAYIHTHGVDKKAVRNEIQKQIMKGMNFDGARKKAHQMYIMSHGSPAYHIPPRPIIEPAIEENRDKINEKLRRCLKYFLNFDFERGEAELKKVGIYAQNRVRAWFTDSRNGWPPNSPYTIKAKKGKSNPLIDTGELRKSITYVVSKEE